MDENDDMLVKNYSKKEHKKNIYLKECKSAYNRDTCTPMFIIAVFTIAKQWNQPRCSSTDEWIKKMWYRYIMEYYSATKKN
jgi:hypothetical protein